MKKMFVFLSIFLFFLLTSCFDNSKAYDYAIKKINQDDVIIYNTHSIKCMDNNKIGIMIGNENYYINDLLEAMLVKNNKILSSGYLAVHNAQRVDDIVYMSAKYYYSDENRATHYLLISFNLKTKSLEILEHINNPQNEIRNIYSKNGVIVIQREINDRYKYEFYDFKNDNRYTLSCEEGYHDISYHDGYFVQYITTHGAQYHFKLRIFDYDLSYKDVEFDVPYNYSFDGDFSIYQVTKNDMLILYQRWVKVDINTGQILPDDYESPKDFSYKTNEDYIEVNDENNIFTVNIKDIKNQIEYIQQIEKKYNDFELSYDVYTLEKINGNVYIGLYYKTEYLWPNKNYSAPMIIVKCLPNSQYEFIGYILCSEGYIIDIIENT